MINTTRSLRKIGLGLASIAFALLVTTTVNAQRDPFAKPGYAKERKPAPVRVAKAASVDPSVAYAPPTIEARIEYFKRLRETAAANGAPLPKVTSVLTLNEMAVTGIFKTPRGYAAMVEATPIRLSYTIYPGEKFFDGQLVAVEENRLVFRKVTKTGPGKFVASVENKPLRQYTLKNQVEGTAPTQSGTTQTAQAEPQPAPQPQPTEQPADETADTTAKKPAKAVKQQKPTGNPFLSPLDEMNSMPDAPASDDTAKNGGKKPKVAKKGVK